MMYYHAVVTENRKLSNSMHILKARILENIVEKPKPLQFTMVWIPGVDELPMSIADYVNNEITILFKVVGEGTRALSWYKGILGMKGFLGNGYMPRKGERILFVAGGSGIAPLPYLVRIANSLGAHVDVVWGVKSNDMLFDVKSIVEGVGEVYYATNDCKTGFCGNVSDYVSELLRSGNKWNTIIAIGPKEMLTYVCKTGNEFGIETYVSLETIVKCGIGLCGNCVVKPYPILLCRQGPVFKCKEVIKHLEI
ncbi:MAG: dihydroorotate dehydrogenase [Desulfurococcaceae archaeon]